jgi:hypothetical protein
LLAVRLTIQQRFHVTTQIMKKNQSTRLGYVLVGLILIVSILAGVSWLRRGPSGVDSAAQTAAPQSTDAIGDDKARPLDSKPSISDAKTLPDSTSAGSGSDDQTSSPITQEAQAQAAADGEQNAPDSNPGNLVMVANQADGPRRISTRDQAAAGKTVASILQDADMSDPATRARVLEEMRKLEETQEKAVADKARQLGIPLRKDGPGNQITALYDFIGDEPLYRTTFNADAAISSAADLIAPAPYSLNGAGVRVGVWDAGSVRSGHQEFTGRVTKKNAVAAEDDHATHVAGTVSAFGVQTAAKGMAPQTNIDSYDWNSDYTEMTAAGATSAGDTARLPQSNHSYGYRALTADMGRYESEASAVDAIASSLPYYLPFWAAGNAQQSLPAKGGYQSITYNSLAKNVVTVGAVNDAVAGGVRSPGAGTIAGFSSLGPCDDGRIKPDIVANGVSVYSPVASGNAAYDSYQGTSMATPSAMGSATLLVQLYAREFSGQRMPASMMKSLLIHTADDVGNPGPDYTYGWGLINVKAAADLILAHKGSLGQPKMIEDTLTNADKTNTHTFSWDGITPIRATVAWTDPAGNAQTDPDSRTPNLKHNLDAKITAPDGSTVYQPFTMPFVGVWTQGSMAAPATRGKNNVDNVEQVDLASPTQPGTYTVTVSLDGTLTTANQKYSLIISGGTQVEINPPPSVTLTSPTSGSAYLENAQVTVSATAFDLAIGGATGAVTQVEFFSGATSIGVLTSEPYALSWTPPGAGTYAITAKATDNEGAVATSAISTIDVLSGTGIPVVSSFAPTTAVAGSFVTLTGVNFAGATAVKFNGTNATYTVDSSSQITATVPALASSGTISVTNPFGTGTSVGTFVIIQPPILISQIYGGAGNTGATYNRDYIELRNRSGSSVTITGWSIQYAAAQGNTWSVLPLSGSIPPGKFLLIGLATGPSGAALPPVNVSGDISLNAAEGKIVLRDTVTPISGSSPVGAFGLQDFVGYGASNASESNPAPSPSTTTALFRGGAGAFDTDDNASDFAVFTPTPRNLSSPAPTGPVITSSTSASATAGVPFSYQIVATNSPTSFGASNLPNGLAISASTGVISGSPTTAGTYGASISATNASGTGVAALNITVGAGGAIVTLISENMGSGATTANDIASNVFQNSAPILFTGVTASVPASAVGSPTYDGASNGKGVQFGTTSSPTVLPWFMISGIDTSGHANLVLSFGHYNNAAGSNNVMLVEVSTTGLSGSWTTLPYTRAAGAGSWALVTPTGTIPSTPNLRIRFSQTSRTNAFRIDDVVLKGSALVLPPPVITANGSTMHPVDTVYGTASGGPSLFTVSGVGISSGILITPPAGFEVSQNVGGGTGYASTQTITSPPTGIVPSKTVYIRLAAGISAGSYSGNVVCSAAGAVPVFVPTVPSTVALKLLTITANDQMKAYGNAISFGAGQSAFTHEGLVPPQTLGTVTLTASGGTAADAEPGTYNITPSLATGGTFNPNNYDFNYVDGVLTVTGLTFNDWLNNYPGLGDPSNGGDSDGDGISNLMEYYMGLSPMEVNQSGVTLNDTPGVLSMTYRRAKGISGATGAVKWSADLVPGTWSTTGVQETSQDMGDHVLRTATVPQTPEDPKKFMRLEVATPAE